MVKTTIDVSGLVEVIMNLVVRHYSFSDLIISDYGLLFTMKFRFSLYYFFGIKYEPSTAFYPQTDGQIERQNSTIEVYL